MDGKVAVIIAREAERQAAAGNYEESLEMLAIVPSNPAAALLRGKVLAQKGDFNRAAACFREALASDPGNPEAQQGLRLAESMAASPFGRMRLHARGWLVAAGLLLAVALSVWAFAGAFASRRELAGSVRTLDGKVSAWQTHAAENDERIASRVDRLEKALETQAQVSAKATEQLRAQVAKLQTKLAGAVTEEQLRATRAEILDSLKRLQTAPSR
jgi:tetratricopeptide (TPR) repeat protein